MKFNKFAALFITASVLLYTTILSAQAWVTLPSGVSVGQTINIEAGGFNGNEAITITIKSPDASTTESNVMTDAEGSVKVSLTLETEGEYSVQAFADAAPDVVTFEATTVAVP